jgi:hypothetical protein
LCAVQKEDFATTNVFMKDKPIFSSERVLHEDYDCKGSVERLGLKGPDAKTN